MNRSEPCELSNLLLRENNTCLVELNRLEGSVRAALISPLLESFRKRILELAVRCRQDVVANIEDLGEDLPEGLPEIRSNTALVLEDIRLLTRCLAGPILRASPADHLALKILSWMHSTDALTRQMPVACQDGDPSVYPFLLFTPLYYFPTLEQQRLLYQPLYFHEFGHVLYALRRPEMDALVTELQLKIDELLEPMSQRNDPKARVQKEFQATVTATWYKWTQELYCDAVGLTMVGPAFLRAFTGFLCCLLPRNPVK